MGSSSHLQTLSQIVVRHRILLSSGLSVAAGIVLKAHLPIPGGDPLVSYAALVRPGLHQLLTSSYAVFLFTTPYLALSMLLSFIYVHFYREVELVAGALPPYPPPASRKDLFLVLGEVHEPLEPAPAPHPRWLSIPEHGLYTGIVALGAIGSGKTQGLIVPAMRQLFGYRAHDPQERLSGIVLEVKGDLCRQLRKILQECGRERDYIEVGLRSTIRYNPLNNDLDPYAQAFNIASIITSIWGRGKEPFWQQSYTDLVRYVILLHRVRDGYLTLVDIFRTVIYAGQLEQLLFETGSRLRLTAYVAISKDDHVSLSQLLAPYKFALDPASGQYVADKGSVSASKHYQKSNEPLFPERAFFELKNAQAIAVAFDGIHPLPATLCYLKPDFLPVAMTWFEQEQINFDPAMIERSI